MANKYAREFVVSLFATMDAPANLPTDDVIVSAESLPPVATLPVSENEQAILASDSVNSHIANKRFQQPHHQRGGGFNKRGQRNNKYNSSKASSRQRTYSGDPDAPLPEDTWDLPAGQHGTFSNGTFRAATSSSSSMAATTTTTGADGDWRRRLRGDDAPEHSQQQQQQQQQSGAVMELLWQYKDPQGVLQGPFTVYDMQTWFDAGYFPENLLVRSALDDQFVELFLYLRALAVTRHSPFTLPIVALKAESGPVPPQSVHPGRPPLPPHAWQQRQPHHDHHHPEEQHSWNQVVSQVLPPDEQDDLLLEKRETLTRIQQSGANVVVEEMSRMTVSHQQGHSPQQQQQQQSQQNAWANRRPSNGQPSKQVKPEAEQQQHPKQKPPPSQQQHQLASPPQDPPKPVWGGTSTSPVARKSLTEIQKEEENMRMAVAQQQQASGGKRYAETAAASSAPSVWGSKPATVVVPQDTPVSPPRVQHGKKPPSASHAVKHSSMASASMSSSNDSLYTAPTSGFSTPSRVPEDDAHPHVHAHARPSAHKSNGHGTAVPSSDTLSWARDKLKPLGTRIDLPSFLEILSQLGDAVSVVDIVHDAIGQNFQLVNPQEFAREYWMRRHRDMGSTASTAAAAAAVSRGGSVSFPDPPVNSPYAQFLKRGGRASSGTAAASTGTSSQVGGSSSSTGATGAVVDHDGFIQVKKTKKKNREYQHQPGEVGAPLGPGGRTVPGFLPKDK